MLIDCSRVVIALMMLEDDILVLSIQGGIV